MSEAAVLDAGIDTRADLLGLAGLIGACDLIVSIDNSVAHLAASLGMPTWILLPQPPARFPLAARPRGQPLVSLREALTAAVSGDWSSALARLTKDLQALR
ncbi:MAG: hypothetical protein MO853_04330 [Candidatus Protistobacter heckmanni]|nr:hypothetical protein [Candidatus Protistobacter heckmanni]